MLPAPSPSEVIVSDSPLIAGPADGEPYTNVPAVDLVLTLPSDAVGAADTFVKIYVALPEQAPAPVAQVPVGTAPQLVVPVTLTEGANNFTATLLGPGGESEASPVVTWILDTAPPAITLTTPADGATINRQVVEIAGTFDGGGWGFLSPAGSQTVVAARIGDFVASSASGTLTVIETMPLRLALDVTVADGSTRSFRFEGTMAFERVIEQVTCD